MSIPLDDRYTILLVEDDHVDRLAIRRLMRTPAFPHHVVEAASCAEARALLATNQFDLALLDYDLGDGYGAEIVPELTAHDIPVIYVTGAGSEYLAVTALRNGIRDYVIKDAQAHYVHGLPTLVRTIVARHRVERERDRLLAELQLAHQTISTLHGLIPICSSCKSIRDDQGYWKGVESYLRSLSGMELTHGLCPNCKAALLQELEHDPL